MRTENLKIFKFDELSDDAKQKAIEWYRSSGHDDLEFEYQQLQYELSDAKEVLIGASNFPEYLQELVKNGGLSDLKCSELDTYRGECKVKYKLDHSIFLKSYIDKIKTTESSKKRLLNALIDWIDYRDGIQLFEKLTGKNFDDEIKELENDLAHFCLKFMRNSEEHINSDEYIIENIRANEYEFLENGKKY